MGPTSFSGMIKLHFLLFFVIYTSLPLVCADYTIDDSNYSILKFSENPAGPVWGPFGSDTGEVLELRLPNGTMQTISSADCYDNTYTYAACSTSNNCAVQFSFSGSGITIYVLQAGPQGMSASLSIDGGTASTATLGAPPAPQYYIPRVTLFNVQNLPSGTHSAVMTVLDWNGGFSGMMLDYINVNQAIVNPSPSPSPSPSPNPSPSPSPTPSPSSANPQTSGTQTGATSSASASNPAVSAQTAPSIASVQTSLTPNPTATGNSTDVPGPSSSSPKNNIAAIAGGVVGGVVGLLALLGLAWFCFRRRRRLQAELLEERPHPLTFPPPVEPRFTNTNTVSGPPFATYAAVPTSPPDRGSRPLQSWTDSDSGSASNLLARESPMANLAHIRAMSSGNDSSTSSAPVSSATGAVASASSHVQESTPPPAPLPANYPNEKARYSLSRRPEASAIPSLAMNQGAVLTDQQADFVNSLFNNNVPAPVVARVLERMLANPQGASTTGMNDPELRAHLGELGDGETTVPGTAPPSYDFVRAN